MRVDNSLGKVLNFGIFNGPKRIQLHTVYFGTSEQIQPLQPVGLAAEFKFESKFELLQVIWKSLPDPSPFSARHPHWHVLQSASTANQILPCPGMETAPRSPGLNPQSPCAWLHLALHTPRHAPSFVPPPQYLPLSRFRPSALGVHAYGELEI